MSNVNIYLLGSLIVYVREVTDTSVTIRFQDNDGTEVLDYGFTWDADIDNGAVIWGEMLDGEVCMHDSVGHDWSISRSEIAEALERMIEEFDDGDMGIETDSLHHFSGFKACGVMTEILDGLIACDPTRS
jgi:hypothetical protein